MAAVAPGVEDAEASGENRQAYGRHRTRYADDTEPNTRMTPDLTLG